MCGGRSNKVTNNCTGTQTDFRNTGTGTILKKKQNPLKKCSLDQVPSGERNSSLNMNSKEFSPLE